MPGMPRGLLGAIVGRFECEEPWRLFVTRGKGDKCIGGVGLELKIYILASRAPKADSTKDMTCFIPNPSQSDRLESLDLLYHDLPVVRPSKSPASAPHTNRISDPLLCSVVREIRCFACIKEFPLSYR